MNSRIVHPGIILKQSFLEPLKITAYRLAKETKNQSDKNQRDYSRQKSYLYRHRLKAFQILSA